MSEDYPFRYPSSLMNDLNVPVGTVCSTEFIREYLAKMPKEQREELLKYHGVINKDKE